MPKFSDAAIRAAAGDAGFTIERATMRGCWRLLDQDGKRIKNPLNGSTAFLPIELIAFLQSQPIR
jgi:hypothetical protein